MAPSPGKQATEGLFADYERLVAKVDAHSTRITAARPDSFVCGAGCTGCCHRQLTVFPVEAGRIRAWLAGRSIPPDAPPPLAPSVLEILELGPSPEPCVMLDGAGQCRIYPVRPLICRTHGLPLAVSDDEGLYADVCPLNFDGGAGLGDLEQDDFLVLDTLNAILAAVNAAYVAATGEPEERVPLQTLT